MDYKPTYLKDPLRIAAALKGIGYSLDGKGRLDTNGKLQIRIQNAVKSITVSLSVVPPDAVAGWENAHSHHGQSEVYAVLTGMVILVLREGKEVEWVVLTPGETFTVQQKVEHNAYIFPGTVSFVGKEGEPLPCPDNARDNDWWPAHELDRYTKELSSPESVKMAAGIFPL